MKTSIMIGALLALWCSESMAQSPPPLTNPSSSLGTAVTNCGTPPYSYVAGQPVPKNIGLDGRDCINASSAPANSAGSFAPATITNASAQVLAANTAKVILDIKNESTTASIACAFGSTAAALNTAGSYTIPPGWHRSWEGSYVPSDAVNCISSAASSPATIEAK